MATEVLMPKWGLTMQEGKITRWFKAEGDRVSKGEPLFEVETSKITNSVESPADGVLFQIVVPPGQTVPVKTVVGLIAQPGEEPQRLPAWSPAEAQPKEDKEKAGKPERGKEKFVPATPRARRLAKEWGIDLLQVHGTGPGGRVSEEDVRRFKERQTIEIDVSPKAKALAEKAGIDLSTIEGSGPAGRIRKVDVLRAMHPAYQKEREKKAAPQREPAVGATPAPGLYPFAGMRRIIADNMMASLRNSAQLSVFVECDVTEMKLFRDKVRAKQGPDGGMKISYNDIIALAVCRALKEHPIMNSWLTDEGIVIHPAIHLGVAVEVPDGLIVPNVKNAHQKSLLELASEIRELAQKARSGNLVMDDIQGGTFTITNVSMLGVDGFTPILNPPETAILGIGRAVEKPSVHQGQICIRTVMTLSLTFDHRVVDGAPAMRFLRTLADLIEDPVMIMA